MQFLTAFEHKYNKIYLDKFKQLEEALQASPGKPVGVSEVLSVRAFNATTTTVDGENSCSGDSNRNNNSSKLILEIAAPPWLGMLGATCYMNHLFP